MNVEHWIACLTDPAENHFTAAITIRFEEIFLNLSASYLRHGFASNINSLYCANESVQ